MNNQICSFTSKDNHFFLIKAIKEYIEYIYGNKVLIGYIYITISPIKCNITYQYAILPLNKTLPKLEELNLNINKILKEYKFNGYLNINSILTNIYEGDAKICIKTIKYLLENNTILDDIEYYLDKWYKTNKDYIEGYKLTINGRIQGEDMAKQDKFTKNSYSNNTLYPNEILISTAFLKSGSNGIKLSIRFKN